MRLSTIAGVLTLGTFTHAFSDTSPFMLFSTKKIALPSAREQLQTGSKVFQSMKAMLAGCPTDTYVIVNQPNVNVADIEASSVPNVHSVASKELATKFTVSEVVGSIPLEEVEAYVNAACTQVGRDVNLKVLALTALKMDDGLELLQKNDGIIGECLRSIPSDASYTFIYLSDTREPLYEAEFADTVHQGLKREDKPIHSIREGNDTTPKKNLSLFEKYQFFTPGIFMGLLVTILLLSVLSVGVSALSSLSVPYGAFEKDMAPTQQKKQH